MRIGSARAGTDLLVARRPIHRGSHGPRPALVVK